METNSLYEDEREQKVHRQAVQYLAKTVGRSVEEVLPLYEFELAHLKERARIKSFLTVLVSQRVKSIFVGRATWQ